MKKANGIAKLEISRSTTATSKRSFEIKFADDCRKQIRALTRDQRRVVGCAIDNACVSWGKPHLHAGAGVRKLRSKFYECRSGLQTRLLFEVLDDGSLFFHLIGSHDEIHLFLKRLG